METFWTKKKKKKRQIKSRLFLKICWRFWAACERTFLLCSVQFSTHLHLHNLHQFIYLLTIVHNLILKGSLSTRDIELKKTKSVQLRFKWTKTFSNILSTDESNLSPDSCLRSYIFRTFNRYLHRRSLQTFLIGDKYFREQVR